MAGRRMKTKLLTETNNDNEKSSNANDQEIQPGLNLPTELLGLILSHLTLRDNIRSSAVCKFWLSTAVSVRLSNKPPWLMFFPKSGDLHRFYNPCSRKYHHLNLPELRDSKIYYAKNEWLLLYKFTTKNMFFFCPYTRESINLPSLKLTYQRVTFSDGPKSTSCIVFTVNQVSPSIVAVSTCRPGDKEWTTVNYHSEISFTSCILTKLVFCEGVFYCFSITGRLGVYDSRNRTWTVHLARRPKCPKVYFKKNWWKRLFMAEHKGDIFIAYACIDENPFIYKLDRANNLWVEIKSLGGMTIFANFLSSQTRGDLLGTMRNNVYFSKVRFYGNRCFSYSLDDARFYPSKHCPDLGEEDPFGTVWIEPPEDDSVFL